MKYCRAFTLIELLMTLALLALFATLALPLAELTVKRSQEAELRIALRQIRNALDAYKQASDEGRLETAPGDSGYPKTLRQLVDGLPDRKHVEARPIFFLRRIPRDPFADPALRPEESWGLRSYLSPYDAPRAGADIYDVHSRSTGIGINGIAYREW